MSVMGSLREMWHLLAHRPDIRIGQVDYDVYWEVKRHGNLGALNAYQSDRVNWIAARVREGESVLDLGCGDGAALLALRSAARIEAVAADVAKKPLAYLGQQGISTRLCDLTQMDQVASMPLCDHVLLLEVLEHFRDSELLLQTAMGRARRAVFFSVPNTGYLPYRLRLLFGSCPVQWRTHPGEHLRFWTMSDLRWWLAQLGLSSRCEISSYQGVPWLNRLAPGLFAAALIVRIDVSEST